MPSFFLAFVACFVAAIGGRDQRLVAVLSARLGQSSALLLTGWLASALTACVMAWLGAGLGGILPPAGKLMFVAIALLLGAAELAWPLSRRELQEPTRSLVPIFLVLAAHQVTDGARFLVLAIAASTGVPALAALGGALAGGLAVTLGWALGGDLEGRFPLRTIRRGVAALLLLAAVWTGLAARGII